MMADRRKTLAFKVILVVCTWFFAEVCALIAWAVVNGGLFSYPAIVARLDAISGVAADPVVSHTGLKWGTFSEVLHPYFGYVAEPNQPEPFWRVSDYGFILSDRPSPIVKRAPDRVVIGVFGGSFANGTYLALKELLQRKFSGTGREVVAINFANGGYKQPQQLIILNTLLALGAEFDAVVNVDGFNEVALPPAELIPQHVNPFFPRSWNRRTADLISVSTLRLIGRAEVLKEQREHWAGVFRARRLYLSPTLSLVWQFRDRLFGRRIQEITTAMQAAAGDSTNYVSHGPAYEDHGEAALYRDLVACWERSSIQMRDVAVGSGARYFHYLQPNQYDPGSKMMNAEERRIALTPDHPYSKSVPHGYPLLRDAGARLKATGIAFTDLTQVFAGVPEPIYVDDCCHVNGKGYDIIAGIIYADLARELPGSPAP